MTTILYPAARRVNNRRVFGLGIFPQRDRRTSVGPAPSDREFVRPACPATAPTVEEVRDRELSLTLSPIQFHGLMDDLAEMAGHRDMVESGLGDW